jgi:hypothetical protein
MAPLLPYRAHAAALSAIAGWEEHSRSFALEGLAPYLPDDLLTAELAVAEALSDAEALARALTAFAGRAVAGRTEMLAATNYVTLSFAWPGRTKGGGIGASRASWSGSATGSVPAPSAAFSPRAGSAQPNRDPATPRRRYSPTRLRALHPLPD